MGRLVTCTTGTCSTGVHSCWYGGGGASLPRSLQLKKREGMNEVVIRWMDGGMLTGDRR